ncbi:MAG: hypothetical protein JSS81_26775 [Acidobacteria bacterium]|nr:hypothetical protein [Acidobacteriota bacterium]
MPYADKDQLISDYIPEAKSNAEKDAIGRILDGVCAFADSYCRRAPGYFNPSPADPSVRRVRGEGMRFLRLPVHVAGSVSLVTFDGQTIDTADYYESDKNGWLYLENNGFGLERTFFAACENRWIPEGLYKVTARWGYPATPADLEEAVRLTVLRVWETQKGTLGQLMPSGFVVERALPPLAREILDRYKRREFEI